MFSYEWMPAAPRAVPMKGLLCRAAMWGVVALSGCSTVDVATDSNAYAQRLRESSAPRIVTTPVVTEEIKGLDKLRMDLGSSVGTQPGRPVSRGTVWMPDAVAELLPSRPISISLKDATLRQTVWLLGKEMGINLILSDTALALNQKVNINVTQVEAKDALADIMRTFDAAASVGQGRSVIVSAEVAQSFYLDPNLSRSNMSSAVGGDLLGAEKDSPMRHNKSVNDDFGAKGDPFDQFAKLVEVMLTEDSEASKVQGRSKPFHGIDRAKGVVFVRAKPSRVQSISELVERVTASSSKQMDIDAQIIDVDLFEGHKFGIDWNVLSKNVASVIGATSVTVPALNTTGAGGLQPTVFQFSGQSAGSTTGGSGLVFGNNSISATVNAIRSFGNVKVVANPTLRLRSGTVSSLTVGDVIRYVQAVKANLGESGGTSSEVVTSSLFSGMTFTVGGRVADTGMIELYVSPTQTSVDENSLGLRVVATGQSVQLPRVRTKSSSNWVSMQPGSIIVMGGLMDSTEDNADSGPPLLSEAKGVGALFRNEYRAKRSRELLVVLRANLVN